MSSGGRATATSARQRTRARLGGERLAPADDAVEAPSAKLIAIARKPDNDRACALLDCMQQPREPVAQRPAGVGLVLEAPALDQHGHAVRVAPLELGQ